MIIRLLVMAIGIAGIVIFFLPMIRRGIVNMGNVIGLVVSVLVLLFATFSYLFSRNFKIVLLVLVLLVIVLLIMVNMRIVKAKRNEATNESVVIVLGCSSKDFISEILNDRIKAAARYLDKHTDAVCIACGGVRTDFYDSEAEYIVTELAKYGIAKSRIITDTTSLNTYENMRKASQIINEKNLPKRVAVATSEFHQYRAALLATTFGLDPVAINASTEKYLYPTFFVRETFAIILSPLRKEAKRKRKSTVR